MTHKPTTKIPMKRRRNALTNYHKRLKLLKSGLPRIVVRKSLKYTIVQVVEYHPEGDRVLVSRTSRILKRYGWPYACGNISSAYLTGYLVGHLAKKLGISQAVLDAGLLKPTKGGRIFAALRGIIDAGIDVPCDEEYLPTEDLIKGLNLDDKRAESFDKVLEALKKEVSK